MKAIIAAIIFSALTSSPDLKGRWETHPSEKGNVTSVVFRNDNSFDGYVNKKPFVTGKYSYQPEDSTLTFTDNGCNGATGIYKVNFFSDADSLRFVATDDSCTERKEGMQKLVMGRVKN